LLLRQICAKPPQLEHDDFSSLVITLYPLV